MSFTGIDIKPKFLWCFSQLVTTNKIPKEDKIILKTLHLWTVLPKTVHGHTKKILPRVLLNTETTAGLEGAKLISVR